MCSSDLRGGAAQGSGVVQGSGFVYSTSGELVSERSAAGGGVWRDPHGNVRNWMVGLDSLCVCVCVKPVQKVTYLS